MSLKNIKTKIQSVRKTSTVTRAMEAVSAVKMRKSQERALTARPYARAALRMLGSVMGSFNAENHPLTRERKEGKDAILLITSGKAREVRIAYTDFRSTFEQEAAVHKILPISLKIMEHIIASITPERGKYSEERQGNGAVAAYTIEPDADEVLAALIPKLTNVAVFHKLLESKASEHSARMDSRSL